MDFKKLKKSTDQLSRLTEALEKRENSQSFDDDRFWQPTVDKAGNGYAVIRFLPAPEADGDDALPWTKYFSHSFQGPTGAWYINKSLTSIGQQDPVSEYNSELWQTGVEENKEIARKQKRKTVYVSNIYVVEDSKNPENEGKVFLYRYGPKIWEKIRQAMNPSVNEDGEVIPGEENKKPVNPFNLWEATSLKLKIRKVKGYRNYDQSTFDIRYDDDGNPENLTALSDNDGELEKIFNSEYSLKEFLDPETYKTYDELKSRLHTVLGLNKTGAIAKARKSVADEEEKQGSRNDDDDDDTDASISDDDSDLEYFKSLADDT